jgi:hypothetical protein
MSQLRVGPERVVEAGGRLGGISTQIQDVHGAAGAHFGAAAGTHGEAAVHGSFARWSAALPQFAQAADRLLAAMVLAGAGYRVADDAVGDTCEPGAAQR